MIRLPEAAVQFLERQGFVIVSTIGADGSPHNSCKGIVKIDPKGKIYLLDVYLGATFKNLKRNPRMSITAVDEHRFIGYCVKGIGVLAKREDVPAHLMKLWEAKVASRVTQRILKNMLGEKGHRRHPESMLPTPAYMVAMEVNEIIDLTPGHLK